MSNKNRTEQITIQNKTKQNKTKQNKTKQNKIKHNTTKQNKERFWIPSIVIKHHTNLDMPPNKLNLLYQAMRGR